MTNLPKYPLEQVLAVKKDRVEKAEKVVEEKKQLFAIEQEKLKRVEAERDEIVQHREDKMQQLLEAFNTGTTSDEVLQKKAYLKIVDEKVIKAREKVKKQLDMVKKAEAALEEAKTMLRQRRLEQEKIEIHKEEWTKETKLEVARQEAKEHDEIGQLMHESQKEKNNDEGLVEALKEYQTDIGLFMELGLIAIKQGDEASAKKLFDAVGFIKPDSYEKEMGYGLVELHKMNLEPAQNHFKTILKHEPENGRALAFLSFSYMLLAMDTSHQSINKIECLQHATSYATKALEASEEPSTQALARSVLDWQEELQNLQP